MDEKLKGKRPLTSAAVLAVLVAVLVAYVGNYHWLYGRGIEMRKIPKVSWSISETLVNADEVKATPLILMPVKYPLFSQAAEDWAKR